MVSVIQEVPDSFDLPHALSDLVITLFGIWVLIEACHWLFKHFKCWRIGRCAGETFLVMVTPAQA